MPPPARELHASELNTIDALIRPLSHIPRAAFVLVGIGLAVGAALLVEDARHAAAPDSGSPPPASWALLALAAALLLLAAPRPGRLAPAALAERTWTSQERRVAAGALYASFLLAAASLPQFIGLNRARNGRTPSWLENNGSWLLWVAALVFFAVAVGAWHRFQVPRADLAARAWPSTLPWRLELALVAGLTGTALFLRLYDLGRVPPGLWFDEGQNGLLANDLVARGAAHPVHVSGLTQLGAPYFYVLGAVLKVTGNSIFAVRLLPALAGAATVPLLYFLASRLYGWRVGAAAAGLLAAGAWSLTSVHRARAGS